MPNYLVWHQHGNVQAPAADESNGNDDEDRMDDMIADISMEYDLGSRDQHPSSEVQNFYRLIATSNESMHDGTNLTVLQAVTHLMAMKSKYTFGGAKELRIAFCQCDWFHPINDSRVDDFRTVEVKHESRYLGTNLLLAHQVYYLSYHHPSLKNWWVIYKVNPEMHTHRYD
jgi:hypothetical protein